MINIAMKAAFVNAVHRRGERSNCPCCDIKRDCKHYETDFRDPQYTCLWELFCQQYEQFAEKGGEG